MALGFKVTRYTLVFLVVKLMPYTISYTVYSG